MNHSKTYFAINPASKGWAKGFLKLEEAPKTECQCEGCQHACKQSPCFGTPEEMEELIALGHKDKLTITLWLDIYTGNPYPLIAPIRLQNGHCTFFQNGKCSIHKNKGIEGKIIDHTFNNQEIRLIRLLVLKTWETEEGLETFKKFI